MYTYLYDAQSEAVKQCQRDNKAEAKKENYNILAGTYNKAVERTTGQGYILKSYDTDVCAIINNEFIRLWDGYSTTTQKHINQFRKMHGLNSIGAADWRKLPIIALY